jgi:signal transduction histidine kinase
LTIEKNVPKNIFSDPNKIHQILFNLISNSIKFTQNGFIKLSVSMKKKGLQICSNNIFLDRDLNNKELEFKVEDSGKGLTKEDQLNLF